MCEKIAFLTTELDLSTKEAQEFGLYITNT